MTAAVAERPLSAIPTARLRAWLDGLGWTPLPYQIAPEGDWTYWGFVAGRGAGKTDAGAHYVHQHATGPACIPGPVPHRIAIAAPTLGDALLTCVMGDSGVMSHARGATFNQQRGMVYWPSGAQARIFGAFTPDDVERWRGPQHCLVWADELAAWRHLDGCWTNMRLGLRLGDRPRVVFTTTPKPRRFLKDLFARADCTITSAPTSANVHLAQSVRDDLYDLFRGTRWERQELGGQVVDEVDGALWSRGQLDAQRGDVPLVYDAALDRHVPDMRRIVVAVDPAVTSGEGADETGIVVDGIDHQGRGWLLEDVSMRGSPDTWARRAVDAYHRWKADRIVAEANNGGEMVELTIRTVDPDVPVKLVHATQGKRTRAEPVAALYEQRRVYHSRTADLSAVEDQMCSWEPSSLDSPDRMDAHVWGITELMVDRKGWAGVSGVGSTIA